MSQTIVEMKKYCLHTTHNTAIDTFFNVFTFIVPTYNCILLSTRMDGLIA